MRLYLGIDLNPSRCNDDASFLSSSDVVTTDCSSVRRCHIGISSRSFPSNIRNFFQGSNHGWATITCETLPRRLLRSVNKRLSCVATSHWTNWISSVGKCRPKRAVPSLIYLRSQEAPSQLPKFFQNKRLACVPRVPPPRSQLRACISDSRAKASIAHQPKNKTSPTDAAVCSNPQCGVTCGLGLRPLVVALGMCLLLLFTLGSTFALCRSPALRVRTLGRAIIAACTRVTIPSRTARIRWNCLLCAGPQLSLSMGERDAQGQDD